MADHNTTTIEAHEIEGFAYIVWTRLHSVGEEFDTASDRRAFLDHMRDLLDIEDVLATAEQQGGPATLPASCEATVRDLIRESGKSCGELIGDGLSGRAADPEADVRRGKGLMSLAQCHGVYEGVTL